MDQTEEGATIQKMSSFKFDEPMKVTIIFEEDEEETEVHYSTANNLELQSNESSNNIGYTQMPDMTHRLSHPNIVNPSNVSIPSQKEVHHGFRTDNQRRPNIGFESHQDASIRNQCPTSFQSQVHHRETSPNVFDQSFNITENQMNLSNGLTLSKNGPISRVSAETSEVQPNTVMNSTARVDGLDTVSHNLISIIRWKHYILEQKGLTQSSEYEYQCKIKKYFYLSYPVVNAKLLPREHDPIFIRHFLLRTFFMLHSKLAISTSYINLAGLFKDMLEWTKEYNKNLTNVQSNDKNKKIKPPSNLPPSNVNSRSYSNNSYQANLENQQDQTLTCLFSLDAPGGELTINVDSNILHNHQTKALPKNNNKNCRRKRNNKLNESDPCPTPPKRNQIHRPRYRIEESNHPFPVTCESVDNDLITNNRTAPSPCEASFVQSVFNQYEKPQNNLPQNETEPFRSSISRDSGFASPHRDFVGNQMNEKYVQEGEKYEEFTPLVTHVTSLNQNVMYINPGNCSVCGTVTNNMCIGCHKHYYCTPKCQLVDWPDHLNRCTR